MFLVRMVLVLALLAALGVAALFALGQSIEPERREVQVTLPLPKG